MSALGYHRLDMLQGEWNLELRRRTVHYRATRANGLETTIEIQVQAGEASPEYLRWEVDGETVQGRPLLRFDVLPPEGRGR